MLSGEEQVQFVQELAHSAPKPVLLAAHQEISPLLRRDPFKIFPLEICLQILSHIKDPKSLIAAAQVSRLWYTILNDDSTWRKLCYDHHYRRRSAAESYIHKWCASDAHSCQTEDQSIMEQDQHDLSVLGVQNHLLVSNTERSFPVIRYGFRLPSAENADAPSPSQPSEELSVMPPPVSDPVFADPITSAYYHPGAFIHSEPDSYLSHFRQQYALHKAWATGGTLAARYTLDSQEHTTVTTVEMHGQYIAVALDTSLILIFHANGMLLRSLYGHVMGVWSLAIHGHTLVSGGCDRDVREWNLQTGACLKILRGHSATVRCLNMPDYKTVISGGRDAVIQVWDLEEGKSTHKLLGHTAPVRRVECIDRDSQRLIVSASYDCTAKVWDRDTGAMLYSLQGHAAQIYSLACTPTHIFTGSLDSTIQVWDVSTGDRVGVLLGHTALVGHLAINGTHLVSGGSDGTVRVWDMRTLKCVRRIAAHDNAISSLIVTDNHIVSAGADCAVNVWDIRSGELIRHLQKVTVEAQWGVAASDDRLFTVYSEDSHIAMELVSFVTAERSDLYAPRRSPGSETP